MLGRLIRHLGPSQESFRDQSRSILRAGRGGGHARRGRQCGSSEFSPGRRALQAIPSRSGSGPPRRAFSADRERNVQRDGWLLFELVGVLLQRVVLWDRPSFKDWWCAALHARDAGLPAIKDEDHPHNEGSLRHHGAGSVLVVWGLRWGGRLVTIRVASRTAHGGWWKRFSRW